MFKNPAKISDNSIYFVSNCFRFGLRFMDYGPRFIDNGHHTQI